ncbi:hypothetical protein RRG08_013528 [Elysia crispata]|uniref:Uncharacterized protein n=1 Tax=Elysia crispata TaxID=231223 RepID=A0AAE0Y0L4_9GAST|nr:hypothetical protein RRG08_013528 [Elysia crispata]
MFCVNPELCSLRLRLSSSSVVATGRESVVACSNDSLKHVGFGISPVYFLCCVTARQLQAVSGSASASFDKTGGCSSHTNSLHDDRENPKIIASSSDPPQPHFLLLLPISNIHARGIKIKSLARCRLDPSRTEMEHVPAAIIY